jgi:hypothetical protein
MAVTERDRKALEFIKTVGVATTSQIDKAVYRYYRACVRRLQMLADEGRVDRHREGVNHEYIYYLGKKPQQAEHGLLLTDAYIRLSEMGEILAFDRTPVWGRLKPDAFAAVKRLDGVYLLALEIERMTGNPFNQNKYEQYHASGIWRRITKEMPRVVVITDKRVKIYPSEIMYVIIPTSLEGLDKIFKEG